MLIWCERKIILVGCSEKELDLCSAYVCLCECACVVSARVVCIVLCNLKKWCEQLYFLFTEVLYYEKIVMDRFDLGV